MAVFCQRGVFEEGQQQPDETEEHRQFRQRLDDCRQPVHFQPEQDEADEEVGCRREPQQQKGPRDILRPFAEQADFDEQSDQRHAGSSPDSGHVGLQLCLFQRFAGGIPGRFGADQ